MAYKIFFYFLIEQVFRAGYSDFDPDWLDLDGLRFKKSSSMGFLLTWLEHDQLEIACRARQLRTMVHVLAGDGIFRFFVDQF